MTPSPLTFEQWWNAYPFRSDTSVGPMWESAPRAAFEAGKLAAITEAKMRCIKEWQMVNDPPCHPADIDWHPCIECLPKDQAK